MQTTPSITSSLAQWSFKKQREKAWPSEDNEFQPWIYSLKKIKKYIIYVYIYMVYSVNLIKIMWIPGLNAINLSIKINQKTPNLSQQVVTTILPVQNTMAKVLKQT